jgi:hypothetical protein
MAESALIALGRGGIAALGNLVANMVSGFSLLVMLFGPYGWRSAGLLFGTYLVGTAGATIFYSSLPSHVYPTSFRPIVLGVCGLGQWRNRRMGGLGWGEDDIRYGRLLGLLDLLFFLYFRGDVIVLGLVASAAVVGTYGVAYKLFEAALALPQLLVIVRQRRLVRTWDTGAADRDLTDTWAVMLTGVCLLAGAVCLCSRAVPAIFGPGFGQTARVATLLAGGLVGYGMQATAQLYLYVDSAVARFRASIVMVQVGGIVLGVVGVAVGARYAGASGAAVGQTLAELMYGIGISFAVLGRVGLRVPRGLIPIAVATGLVEAIASTSAGWWVAAVCFVVIAVTVGSRSLPELTAIVREW